MPDDPATPAPSPAPVPPPPPPPPSSPDPAASERARREVLDALGVTSLDDAKALAKAARKAQDADRSAAERLAIAERERDEAKAQAVAAAETAQREARAAVRDAHVEMELALAGVGATEKDDEKRAQKIEWAAAGIKARLDEDADRAKVAEAVKGLADVMPELFTKAAAPAPPGGGGTTRTPPNPTDDGATTSLQRGIEKAKAAKAARGDDTWGSSLVSTRTNGSAGFGSSLT